MHRLKRGRSAFRQRANQVDDDLGPDHGTMHRALAHHRGIKRHDLPNRTHWLEEQRRLRVAHRNPHDVTLLGQSLDHIAADEAGTAEHRRHAPYRHGREFPLRAGLIRRESAPLKVRYIYRRKRLTPPRGGGYIARPPFCPRLSWTNGCPDGGIGRRAGFRYLWPQGRGSSSFLPGTKTGGNPPVFTPLVQYGAVGRAPTKGCTPAVSSLREHQEWAARRCRWWEHKPRRSSLRCAAT